MNVRKIGDAVLDHDQRVCNHIIDPKIETDPDKCLETLGRIVSSTLTHDGHDAPAAN